jgi:hypothetical protein
MTMLPAANTAFSARSTNSSTVHTRDRLNEKTTSTLSPAIMPPARRIQEGWGHIQPRGG